MKKALVVVDYQNDFVNGALGFDGAQELEPIILKKLAEAKAANTDIFFTFDCHDTDYMNTMEGAKLPVPHCIKGTDGYKLYGALNDYKNDAVMCIDKPTFGSIKLGEALAEGGYSKVELCGLVSNICVISNAVIAKAALPNAKIVVDAEATASADSKLNEEALDIMQGLHIDIINR